MHEKNCTEAVLLTRAVGGILNFGRGLRNEIGRLRILFPFRLRDTIPYRFFHARLGCFPSRIRDSE